MDVKQFAFEILGVDLLKSKHNVPLSEQIEHALRSIAESEDPIHIEDPANPTGNDLMPLLNDAWHELRTVAEDTISDFDSSGWESVYGDDDILDTTDDAVEKLAAAVFIAKQEQPTQPWCEQED